MLTDFVIETAYNSVEPSDYCTGLDYEYAVKERVLELLQQGYPVTDAVVSYLLK